MDPHGLGEVRLKEKVEKFAQVGFVLSFFLGGG